MLQDPCIATRVPVWSISLRAGRRPGAACHCEISLTEDKAFVRCLQIANRERRCEIQSSSFETLAYTKYMAKLSQPKALLWALRIVHHLYWAYASRFAFCHMRSRSGITVGLHHPLGTSFLHHSIPEAVPNSGTARRLYIGEKLRFCREVRNSVGKSRKRRRILSGYYLFCRESKTSGQSRPLSTILSRQSKTPWPRRIHGGVSYCGLPVPSFPRIRPVNIAWPAKRNISYRIFACLFSNTWRRPTARPILSKPRVSSS